MNRIDIYKTEKRIRASVIKRYMERNGIKTAVCFSCGNAVKYLLEAGVDVLGVAPSGDLSANRWFTMEEIRKYFSNSFDATSGHLPIDIMNEIAEQLKNEIYLEDGEYSVASGSGETFICLSMAFPKCHFIAEYNDENPATKRDSMAPLNQLIDVMNYERR